MCTAWIPLLNLINSAAPPVKSIRPALPATSSTTPRGNLNRQISPVKAPDSPVEFEYDPLNRVISTKQGSDVSITKYDANGRVSEDIDFKGNRTLHFYDAAGRRIRTVEAYGTTDEATTKYEYDKNDNLTKVIDANHTDDRFEDVLNSEIAIITYDYDEINRRIRENDASSFAGATDAEITVDYDANGNPAKTTRRDGTVVIRSFDALNRLQNITVDGSLEQHFEYDKLSRLIAAVDHNEGMQTHTVDYRYDFASRVIQEEQYDQDYDPANPPPASAIRRVSTEFTDVPNNSELSQSITKTYPFGSHPIFQAVLDKRGQLSTVTDKTENRSLATFTHDSLSRPADIDLHDPTTSSPIFSSATTYDNRGRESNRQYTDLTEILFDLTTAYDKNSNIDEETISGILPKVTGLKEYSHDALNRLTLQEHPVTNDLEWVYDRVGNILETNESDPAADFDIREVNHDNEYLWAAEDANESIADDYDSNGNLTTFGNTTFIHDWATRLVEVQDGGATVATYTYDGANRRVTKAVNSVMTIFVYDGPQVVQELDNGELERTFVYGEFIDSPIALYQENTGEIYFYIRDRRANIIGLVDVNGNVVEKYEYTPFGQMTIYDADGMMIFDNESAIGNPYGFTGRRWDPESELWYYRNRMYSDYLGRFLQRDPAGFVDSYNLYAYTANNPLAFGDPSGLGLLSFVAGYGWSGPAADAFEASIGESAIGFGTELGRGIEVIGQEGFGQAHQFLVNTQADAFTTRILSHQSVTQGNDLNAAISSATGFGAILSDFSGATQFFSGVDQIDSFTGASLTDLQSTQNLLIGGGTFGLNIAVGTALFQSARAGYTGTGIQGVQDVARFFTTFEDNIFTGNVISLTRTGIQIARPNTNSVIVNLGGEGEVPGAVNVQGRWALDDNFAISRTGQSLAESQAEGNIFVIMDNKSLSFPSTSVDVVITNSVPIDINTFLGPGVQTSEITRILGHGGIWINNGITQNIGLNSLVSNPGLLNVNTLTNIALDFTDSSNVDRTNTERLNFIDFDDTLDINDVLNSSPLLNFNEAESSLFDLGGGQSAPFIARDRLIRSNSRSIIGRATFTGRNDRSQPLNMIQRLFK